MKPALFTLLGSLTLIACGPVTDSRQLVCPETTVIVLEPRAAEVNPEVFHASHLTPHVLPENVSDGAKLSIACSEGEVMQEVSFINGMAFTDCSDPSTMIMEVVT